MLDDEGKPHPWFCSVSRDGKKFATEDGVAGMTANASLDSHAFLLLGGYPLQFMGARSEVSRIQHPTAIPRAIAWRGKSSPYGLMAQQSPRPLADSDGQRYRVLVTVRHDSRPRDFVWQIVCYTEGGLSVRECIDRNLQDHE
jgi:hypothetical protein